MVKGIKFIRINPDQKEVLVVFLIIFKTLVWKSGDAPLFTDIIHLSRQLDDSNSILLTSWKIVTLVNRNWSLTNAKED